MLNACPAARVLLALAFTVLSLTPAQRARAAVVSCPIIVQNGGFEAQPLGAGWTQSGAGATQLITNLEPFRGSYSAELGGLPNTDHSIKQQITLPTGGPTRLTFWWEHNTTETAPGAAADYLTISIVDGLGQKHELDKLGVQPPDPVSPPWAQRAYDLSAYRGQTVQLEFQLHNDPTNPTTFYIDEVTIPGCFVYLPLMRR